jgi:hypothetical protein
MLERVACTRRAPKGEALTAYDLHWIDGPAPGDAPDEYARRASFRVSEPMMVALYREMERQGMLGHKLGSSLVGDWETKLETSGAVVTRNELVVALVPSTNNPAPPDLEDMPMEEWRDWWERWLDFLVGAMQYGGFRIEPHGAT